MQAKSFAIMLSKAPVLTPVWGLSLIALKVPPAVHTSYSSKARQPWKLGLGAAANCFNLFNASTLSIASARCQNQHFLWTVASSHQISCHVVLGLIPPLCVHSDKFAVIWAARRAGVSSCESATESSELIKKKKVYLSNQMTTDAL